MALEESQSLLMEMIVCRSRPFVTYLKPLLEKHFGVSGPEWSEENLYAHLTRVKRGPIRVDADELTYTLHIQLRYELENKLLEGSLAVRNLRDAWNASMEQRLGVRPQNDLEGVLQDVHWAVGSFGYFPSYALGAVMAAQFYDALRESVPDVEEQIAEGDKVVTRFEWTGTHRGEFLGVAATGRSVRVWGMVIDRLQSGRIKDTRIIMDTLGLMMQLGVFPPPKA